ncbi:MAG: hypothetical protein HY901_17465 [Deltaproteobacteria bacterium]|nr:hypothetical protein [Deltaproteobacteria bacterium]
MAVRKSSPVAIEMTEARQGRRLTFSEILQAVQTLASKMDLTSKSLAAQIEQLQKTAQSMESDEDFPFIADLIEKSVTEARNLCSAAQRSLKHAPSGDAEAVTGAAKPPSPFEAKRIGYDAAASIRSVGGANALLAAQVVACSNQSDVEQIREALRSQFDTCRVIDGKKRSLPGARVLVGTREDDRLTMVAIRGTSNLVDAARDATVGCMSSGSFEMADGPERGFGAGAVHFGFAEHLDTVWPSIRGEVLDAASHDRTVVLTGHSLGAATAELAMARAVNDPEILEALRDSSAKPPAVLETFAQPSVGDLAFENGLKESLDALGIPYHTYGYRDDPVTQVPPTQMPDAQGRTFVRPHAIYAALSSRASGATISLGRPPETVHQRIRMERAHFAADMLEFVGTVTSKPNGYYRIADHLSRNYFEALRDLWDQGHGTVWVP